MVDRIEFIEKYLSEKILEDRVLRKAVYKEFQEAVEVMSDICALARRGLNSSARDDYSNINFLVEKGILEKEMGKKLKEANGLRNRLIHEYDGVNDKMAYQSMKELVDYLKNFSVVILEWIRK
ncbi:MAG: DUF86 domain-containing protein [Candidatus Thermoplasmatota archaeon]|nr:DUF86 domain-containing protein [Candidatus Thermoplasmatota archaeon]